VTGVEDPFPQADEAVFQLFSRKYSEIIKDQTVRSVYGRGGPPTYGAIWGVMIGWAYDHLGVYSWVPEMGSLVPFCDYDENGRVSQMEQLKWNDEEMEGRVFIDWEPFRIHTQALQFRDPDLYQCPVHTRAQVFRLPGQTRPMEPLSCIHVTACADRGHQDRQG